MNHFLPSTPAPSPSSAMDGTDPFLTSHSTSTSSLPMVSWNIHLAVEVEKVNSHDCLRKSIHSSSNPTPHSGTTCLTSASRLRVHTITSLTIHQHVLRAGLSKPHSGVPKCNPQNQYWYESVKLHITYFCHPCLVPTISNRLIAK
jgi:hypothetical protein